MILKLENGSSIDTNKFFDASLTLQNTTENPRAWYVDSPVIEPVRMEGFVGSVAEGNSVNFRNIAFNPHGHSTHIECLGHVTSRVYSINELFKDYFLKAKLITVQPQTRYNEEFQAEDQVITAEMIKEHLNESTKCLMIRTTPNDNSKTSKHYSNTNFPYLDAEIVPLLDQYEITHLVVDLPSVDREEDKGVLAFHKAFWKINDATPRFDRTITEFAYFANEIPDGNYILNMQVAPIDNDASICRPILFPIISVE